MKILHWLSKLILTTALISVISVITAWYTVQTLVQDVLKGFQLQTSAPGGLAPVDWMLRLARQTGLMPPVAGSGSSGVPATEKNATEPPAAAAGTGVSSIVPSAAEKSGENDPFAQDAVAVWSDSSGAGQEQGRQGQQGQAAGEAGMTDASEAQKEVVMSAEDFSRKRELLSDEDKMKVFSLLISRIPQEDVQTISSFIENGITGDELRQMEEIVKKRLSSEEYGQLLEILNKY